MTPEELLGYIDNADGPGLAQAMNSGIALFQDRRVPGHIQVDQN